MSKHYLFSAIIFLLCLSSVKSQNFSNKGKDFWLGYGYHVSMANSNGTVNAAGGGQDMVLYFTSDKNANVTVEIPALSYLKTYTVTANQVTETAPLPKTGIQDCRISDTGYFNRGIHIYSDVDIVSYAHIYASAVSGASLLFPTNTLGNDYYVISYNQQCNANYANSFAFVVAVEDNTVVEITPSVANKNNKTASVPFQVTLNKGQVYNLMGTTNGTSGTDLTGTRIRTIAASGACKKIAMFCGAGKMSIGGTTPANNQTGSADNLFAQALPASAWGLKYLTSPTGSQPNNYYRICVTDPSTVVKLNGVQISSTYLQRNFFYELKNAQPLSTPGNGIGLPNNGATTFNLIEADKPINVAQYCTTQGTDGNPSSPGDPEMIYLSPVEQTINKITLNSTPHYNITTHGINVIIKKGGVNSFTLDGVNKSSSFITHPQDANYAYASFSVAQGSHALYSDTGFNAIAYGFGNAESYGYNAGTNIKDLYAPVFQNPYARINFAATCVGTPFQFSIPLSYQPSSLTWNLSSSINLSPNTNIGPVTPVADSTPVIGGKKLYYYSPANGASGGKMFTYTKAGADTIKVYATNPSPDGCSSSNAEYTIPVTINAVPTANFSVNNSRCITDAIQFTDASSNLGTSTVLYGLWNWNDGTTDSLRNPSHKFPSPKIYTIRYRPITDFGCNGDTTIPVEISAAPIARFVYSDSCVGKQLTLTDSSAISAGTIVKWYWDYGDGTKDTLTSNTPRTKTYTSVGKYTITLTVESNTGCKSNPFIQNITIRSLPNTYFGLPAAVCMPSGIASFSDSSTVAGGTITKWKWSFGDGGTDSVKNPTHYYAAVGTYAIKLTATSNYGCIKDSTIQLNNIYAQPKAGFSIADKICLRDTTTVISSGATFAGNNMTIIKRFWLMGDGTTDSVEMPKHVYAASGVDTVKFWVMTNKGCLSDTAVKTTVVNPLPLAGFYSQANNNYCEKRAITFIDTAKNQSINTASLTRWFWDMGNGTTINSTNGGYGTSFNQYYTSFATYNVKMMVENSLGCKSDTVTKPVLIHAQPLVGFVLPEVCLADKSADFTDTTKYPDGSTATSYLWTYNAGTPAITPGPNITTSTSQNGSTKYNKADIYKVTFKIVTNYGCDSTLVQSFTVNGSIPHASFVVLNNSKLCSNDSVRIYDSSWVDFGTVTRNEIFWDLINAPVADSVDESPYFTKKYAHLYPNFQSPASKTYQVKMIAHSGNSSVCANTISKIVTINQSPKVQFITMPGICNDTTTRPVTQASETGGVPGIFAFYGTGVNSTGVYTPQSVAPGTYPIKYVYTTAFSCADSATKNLVVWPSPQAKWSIITSPLCEKNVIQFADSSKANYSRIASRYWDFGDGTNTVYSNTVAFSKIYASGNTYAVSLRVITDSGCRSTYNIQNIKINFLPVVNFGLPSICLPDGRGTFTDSTIITDNTSGLFSYLWNFGDPNDPSSSTLKNPIHRYSALGPVNVQLKVTSSQQCVDSLTKVFTAIYPQPKATFGIVPDTACYGDNIQFTDSSNGITSAAVKWNWDLANGYTSSIQNPVKKFTDTGNFTISLYIYNQQNCVSDTAYKQVVIYPYPKLTMGPDLRMLQGGQITIKPAYIYGHGLQYLWTPASFLSSDTARNPIAMPDDDITYKLTVTGNGGCAVSDTIFIKVLKQPTVPNAFSPNDDGINDTWEIKYLDSYPGATIDVYDRYGLPVFHSDGYTVNWDGTSKGKPLPIGTYYYFVNPKNGRPVISGSVTIIR